MRFSSRLLRILPSAAIFCSAGLLASCAVPQASAPGLSGTLPSAVRAARPSSPYERVMSDGSTVHVYLPPAQRAALQVTFPDHVEYHGGPIIQHSVTYAIFWRPRGTFMDAKYEPVIEQFFKDVGDTTQYNILTQYYDRRFGIQNASSFGGSWTDTSDYPSDFNRGGTGDKDLHAEVRKAIAINHWPQGGITPIYAIFTASQSPADKWAACAYHASFTSGGTTYVYTIVPYQHDYGPHGCGTPSNVWPNDRDADQTIDTLWHEQAEATSDPNTSGYAGAWYSDRSGAEIGDLCETSYGKLRSDGSDTTLHGHDYVTQEIWSNFNYHCLQTQPR